MQSIRVAALAGLAFLALTALPVDARAQANAALASLNGNTTSTGEKFEILMPRNSTSTFTKEPITR